MRGRIVHVFQVRHFLRFWSCLELTGRTGMRYSTLIWSRGRIRLKDISLSAIQIDMGRDLIFPTVFTRDWSINMTTPRIVPERVRRQDSGSSSGHKLEPGAVSRHRRWTAPMDEALKQVMSSKRVVSDGEVDAAITLPQMKIVASRSAVSDQRRIFGPMTLTAAPVASEARRPSKSGGVTRGNWRLA